MAKVPRLLDHIIPTHYKLKLSFGQADTEFAAEETVTFELKAAARVLKWHGAGLKVTRAEIGGQAAQVVADAKAQTLTLTFAKELPAGPHELELAFTGPIQDSLHGLYASAFQAADHTERMIMTQFEAVHAREAFVCIDEPAAKATFELTLVVDDGLTALTNTPVAEESVARGRRTVRFERTPKMSTYLLAWVVSKLASVEATAKSGVKLRVYGTPDHAPALDYAVDFARRSLDYYENYFAIPYPLAKLDLVAVPNFAAGAMENWGLVTYRETDLLVDEANTSLANKQRVSEVIAHELAHQWFGDLVTMAWWDDLWLNESFASWAETMTVDHLVPEWHWWDSFTAGLGTYAKEIDGLANTHPIQVEVDDPLALDEIFDAISYFKGQSIIRMLEGYLGAEVFRDGLRLYLKRHAYANSATDDLWKALSEASGKNVSALMHAWTALAGFPILSFAKGGVHQERFLVSPRETTKAAQSGERPTIWPVPLSLQLPNGSMTEPVLIDKADGELPAAARGAEWFKPNPGQSGFYRTRYDEAMIAALTPALTTAQLPPADRFGVVSDVWAATASGRLGSRVALQLTEALRGETEYVAALAVYESLGELLATVEDEAMRAQLEQFGRWLAEPNFGRLGWEVRPGESHFDTLLRPVVLQQAVRYEVPGVANEGLRRFGDYAAGGALDPNVRSAVLYAAGRFGETTQYEQLLELYRHESAPHTRQAQLVSLGRFRQPELARRTLAIALSDEVKSQDVFYAVAGVARTREHRELVWQWLKANWDELVRRFGDGGHMLDRFPEMGAGGYATHAHAKAVADFFAAHPHPAITRPVAQAVEAIELRADWFERDRAEIAAFLKDWSAKPR